MELNCFKFSIFCVFFCGPAFSNEIVTATGATCEFGVKEVYPIADYGCELKSFDLSGSNTQTEILGDHKANKNDDDVIFVSGSNITLSVPILNISFCQKFPNLEVIQLNWIEFEQIDPKTFENCRKVNFSYLYLEFNKIREIPENLLAKLPKLLHLSFDTNQISTIHPNAFRNQKELELLFLSYNKISSLPPKVFEPLSNLNILLLDHNQLKVIHSDSFGIHRYLNHILIYENEIDAIDEKFIDNTAVDVLNMGDNICYGNGINGRREMKKKLRRCFENYKPRSAVNGATGLRFTTVLWLNVCLFVLKKAIFD